MISFCFRCEVRPGPKHLTRYIQIFRNSSWQGRFHYYSDYSCNKPIFTVYIKGHYTMGREGALKGSTSTNFNFTLIELHPHTVDEEKEILKVEKKACPNTLRNISSEGGVGVYVVDHHAFNRRTCRNKFLIGKYELQMVKLDKLKDKGSREDRLYFSEIPFGKKIRRRNALNSYQTPLKRSSAPNCTVCGKVKKSTVTRPYSFTKKQPLPVLLDNEWGSFTCETRPDTFLSRYMTFNSKLQSFEGFFHYFSDPYCKKLDFVLHAKGHFTGGLRSSKVRDGENYVFTVTEASITPYKKSITRRLNYVSRNDQCGKDGEWQTGVAQDITKSKGCKVYGINLPHTEYDLLMMAINDDNVRELYIGQRASDGTSPTSPSSRPTSYQIPLVECSSLTKIHFVPPTPEPTTKPSTRYPRPKPINPILTVPTLKRDDDKTTPKQKGKSSKGTKGSSTNGVTVQKQSSTVSIHGLSEMCIAIAVIIVGLL